MWWRWRKRVQPPSGDIHAAAQPPSTGRREGREGAQDGSPVKCVRSSGPHVAGGITGWLYVCHDRKRHEVDVILGSDGSVLNIHIVPD